MNSRVCLIGPRGAGKSAVGRALAARLAVPFHDTDEIVERETGLSIAALMEQGVFRLEEARVMRTLLAGPDGSDGPDGVVATGGGAVLWDGFRDATATWRVIWLDADPAVLADRIAQGPPRPSLTGADPADEIAEVARTRAPLYDAASTKRVDTSTDDPETVAATLAALLRDGDTDVLADE